MGFWDKPKVQKDYKIRPHWPWIHLEQEGMSFNPIRVSGAIKWFAQWFVVALLVGFAYLCLTVVGYVLNVIFTGLSGAGIIMLFFAVMFFLCYLGFIYVAINDDD